MYYLNFEKYYQQANKLWQIDLLFEKLAKTKCKPLSESEKIYVIALVLGMSQKKLAEETFQALNSLRTTLSRSIYIYMKDVLDIELSTRISWFQFAKLLEKTTFLRPITNQEYLINKLKNNLSKINIEEEKIRFLEKINNKAQEITCYRVMLETNPVQSVFLCLSN